jgi:hypothetical protein
MICSLDTLLFGLDYGKGGYRILMSWYPLRFFPIVLASQSELVKKSILPFFHFVVVWIVVTYIIYSLSGDKVVSGITNTVRSYIRYHPRFAVIRINSELNLSHV